MVKRGYYPSTRLSYEPITPFIIKAQLHTDLLLYTKSYKTIRAHANTATNSLLEVFAPAVHS